MKKKTTINPLFLGLLLAGVLTGCESDGVTDLAKQDGADLPSQESLAKASPYARFDPAGGVIPFPNNLLFNGSQDGTLNIPVADPEDYADPQVAMNALDGFSTLTSFNAQMSAPLDPASIIPGETVRVYQVNLDPETTAVTGVSGELVAGREYTAGVSPFDDSTVIVTPLAPLAPGSGYLVTLGKGLKSVAGEAYTSELYYALAESGSALVDEGGNSLFAALSNEDAQKLEPLRQLTNAAEAAVEGYTVAADTADAIPDQSASDIILSWSFKTQSIGASLDEIAKSVTAQTVQTTFTNLNTKAVNGALPGVADIHTGTLDVPYYSSAPTTADPTAPLTGFWHTATGGFVTGYNRMPEETATETIPVLMTLPNANSGHTTMPGTGWPVVIFQHGITQNRTHLLAVADTLAAAGFAGIAIDLPLHGITDATSPFYADGTVARERTFGLDLIDNETRAPGPDSVTDPSGIHFINLSSLLTTRDNVRQAVADLMTLTKSLSNVPELDESNVYFVGHSLGAMVGTPYLAHNTPAVKAAVLGFPGGGIAKLLDGSATFGPEIAAGLAAKGVVRGTQDYESFMLAAQTIIDTADPINYATGAVTGRGILMFEIVGGNSGLPDQVVPNNVLADAPAEVIPSPTAGTDPLARAMGLTQYGTPQNGTSMDAWVRFTAGHHGSLVTPNDAAGNGDASSLAVFSELHGEMASFLASDGTILNIADDTVIEQPAAP